MKKVLHHSIQRESHGGVLNTTLCGRMDNNLEDGWNIAEGEPVTCKHCLNAEQTYWGKKIIEQAI